MNPASHFNLVMVRRAVVVPTIICLWYLVWLWRKGELYGRQLQLFVFWFLVTLTTELASRETWVWIAGFLGQVSLAIVLVVKHQWNNT